MEAAALQLGKQESWNFGILITVQQMRGEAPAELLMLMLCYPQMGLALAYLQT